MPSHTQTTVDIKASTRGIGNSPDRVSTSDSNSLAASFAGSPIHNGELTPEERRAYFQSEVLDATINDEGHTFGTYDTSYTDAPDVANDVDIDAHNLPSAFVPNPTSPGPGNGLNAASKPAPPEGFGQSPSDTWGSGVGSQLSPKASSEAISGHTLGDYIAGEAAGS